MRDTGGIGADWLIEQVEGLTEVIVHISPTEFNEKYRYLPSSVSTLPGYLRYDVNPYMREIVDCFDPESPVREVNLMKGVQITYTTALESVAFFAMAHIKTRAIAYITADADLAKQRIENNFLPMLHLSGFSHIIRSSDDGNTRKTGNTAKHLQFEGGGYLLPYGARNANKMRSASIPILLEDEIDAYPDVVGKDGDPIKLLDGRAKAYWETRKIFRGSTPLIKASSKIWKQYKRGDQREYRVRCLNPDCMHPQALEWYTKDEETGVIGGFKWGYTEQGQLDISTVRYCCQKCGHEHYEHDKERLFSSEEGAEWVPTAIPEMPGIRSYKLPAFYSPSGFQPWYACVADFLEAYDPVERRVRDIGKYQVFYNNIRGEPFNDVGGKVTFRAVSAHRRPEYNKGEIPNAYAQAVTGDFIRMLTCTVDVHKDFLSVAVIGWTKGMRSFVIDYFRLDQDQDDVTCEDSNCRVWGRLAQLIEGKRYKDASGREYWIAIALVDSGWANDTVVGFCAPYPQGVYAIVGRDRPAKAARIVEFSAFTTSMGRLGFKIVVDHYKDRLSASLRRAWHESDGPQPEYHFNAPINLTDRELTELTVEYLKEKQGPKGGTTWEWHRPGNARNELWDLLVYGSAAVEIAAWDLCVRQRGLETVDWELFWSEVEKNQLYFSSPSP